MEYIINYFNSSTNYGIQNKSNSYNLIYDIIRSSEDKDNIIILIKKNMGLTFYNDFVSYAIRKNLILEHII